MNTALVTATLNSGEVLRIQCPVSAEELEELEAEESAEAPYRLLQRAMSRSSHTRIEDVRSWRIDFLNLEDFAIPNRWDVIERPPSPGERKIAKCRSLLGIANRLLPASAREDALDEWMDELECAAASELPVFPRTFSILFRALPAAAWHSRRPSWARRGGG